MKKIRIKAALCLAGALALQPPIWAQAATATPTPGKPVRIVVTVPPGGGIDTIARRLAAKVAPAVGQPVIVENRPGASGMLGVDNIVKSAPDGSSLILAAGSTITVLPHLMKKMPYDATRDLTPITQIGVTPLVMLVKAESPAKDLADFVAAAKARPGTLSYGSYGNGTLGHLIGEVFKHEAGVDLVHVPYKGCAAAINDLIGGQVSAVFCDIGSSAAFLQPGGRLRGLSITGTRRITAYPTVPTFSEAGYPTLGPLVGWLGIFGPANMSKPLVDALVADFGSVMKTADMRSALAQVGYEIGGPSAAGFAKTVQQDTQVWGQLIQRIGGIALE
ncbi:Bug family tripartite tricarboxylate transporter substrate binding protein [Cupriavidus sp. 2TAF22]|uniref:Bug family tripartite tricarboxylate transporter substrate binding protein n=1 Tax=unclassified Cupriavidus TaxID=2640874 RepID=UPI003F8FB959